MELRQLQYFVAAADTLNFSRAAESLYISQPTLSQQIAELERELGVQLFERTKRSVLLTNAGAALLVQAKDLLHRSESLMETVRNVKNHTSITGNLCIGYEAGATANYKVVAVISNACAHLRETYPGIRIFYKDVPSDLTDRTLRDRDVDIVLHMIHDTGKGPWNSYVVHEQELVYHTYNKEPLEDTREVLLKCLRERPVFLSPKDINGMDHIMTLFHQLGTMPNTKFMDNMDTARMIVASGDGAMVIPSDSAALPRWEYIRELHFGLPEAKLTTVLEWDPNNLNPMIQLLLDQVQECMDIIPVEQN